MPALSKIFTAAKMITLFYVTHEGIHYFELRRKNFRYLFFTSIFLPILVSAVTTIITILIAG